MEGGGGLRTSIAPASSARPTLLHPPDQRSAKGTGEFTELAASEPDDQRRRQAADDLRAMPDAEAIELSLAQFRQEFDRRRLGVPTTPKLADESRIRLELRHLALSSFPLRRRRDYRVAVKRVQRRKRAYVTKQDIGFRGSAVKTSLPRDNQPLQANGANQIAFSVPPSEIKPCERPSPEGRPGSCSGAIKARPPVRANDSETQTRLEFRPYGAEG